jgi:hypothetical protein
MASFNNTFNLSVRDIEVIEKALRNEISELTGKIHNTDAPPAIAIDTIRACDEHIRLIHQVLGKLHNQKIWYGQVNQTGVPISG